MSLASAHLYWRLTKALCLTIRWMKWVLLSGILLTLLAGAMYVFSKNLLATFIGVVGLTAVGIFIVFLICSFPVQALSVASSKQFFMLPNLRKHILFIMLIISLLFSLALPCILSLSNKPVSYINLFSTTWFELTFFFVFCIFVFQKWPRTIFLIGVFWLFFVFATPLLIVRGGVYMAIATVLIWSLFSFWWLKWKPTKFLQNLWVIEQSGFMKSNSGYTYDPQLAGKLKIKPESLFGTFLLGNKDGWKSHLVRGVMAAISILLAIVILKLIFSREFFQGLLSGPVTMMLYFGIAGYGFGTIIAVTKNLHKVWLFHNENRMALLQRVESIFITQFLYTTPPVIMLFAAINFTLSDNPWSFSIFSIFVSFSYFYAIFYFYAGMIVYVKTKASTLWVNIANVAILMLSLMVLPAFADVLQKNLHDTYPVYLLVLCIGALAVFTLRVWLLRIWPHADLLRSRS